MLFFFFPEASGSNILYHARCLRKATGNHSIMSAPEIAAEAMSRRDRAVEILVRPFALNFQEPIVFALNVYKPKINVRSWPTPEKPVVVD